MKRLMTIAIRDFGTLLENCVALWNVRRTYNAFEMRYMKRGEPWAISCDCLKDKQEGANS